MLSIHVDANTKRREVHSSQLLQYDHQVFYCEKNRRTNKIDTSTKQFLIHYNTCCDATYTPKSGKPTFHYPQHAVEHIAETFFLKMVRDFSETCT